MNAETHNAAFSRANPCSSAFITLRKTLFNFLDVPFDLHRKTILAGRPPLNEILTGRRPVVLFPAARMATVAAALLQARGVDVRGFSDKNPSRHGQTINGLPVVSPTQITTLSPSASVLVASSLHDSAICEFLGKSGCTSIFPMPYLSYCLPDVFPCREYSQAIEAPYLPGAREQITQLFELLADDASRQVLVNKIRYYLSLDKKLLDDIKCSQAIYFDAEIHAPSPDESVVDGGAFNGDTLQQFLGIVGGHFRQYYAFEPDAGVFVQIRKVAAADPARIECVCAGLSDRTGTMFFSATGAVDSAFVAASSQSSKRMPVVDLDTYFSDRRPPTLIKMDIEGGERAALEGSRRLIGEHRPTLAVSAYHFPKDIWEIPLLLAQLSPGARIYLRHYKREIDDTVCYAIP